MRLGAGPHIHRSEVLMLSPFPHLSGCSFSASCPHCCGQGYLEATSSRSPSALWHQRPLWGTLHPALILQPLGDSQPRGFQESRQVEALPFISSFAPRNTLSSKY